MQKSSQGQTREQQIEVQRLQKQHSINTNNLSGAAYFASLLEEAYNRGLLSGVEIENIQMECIKFLAAKSQKFNGGDSSSIRIEDAESIMKSNLYTIGLYLKSLPDADFAVSQLKTEAIPDMYRKGRKLINVKLATAKHLYQLVQKNSLNTENYTYNATLGEGIESFFTLYDADYQAQEIPASIDYQLCNPVSDLVGVEFVQKYLENVFFENEFCSNYPAEDIHHVLSGYDEGYQNLLINIFEQVLTQALGCYLAKRRVDQLDISEIEIQHLQEELLQEDEQFRVDRISQAAEQVLEKLQITSPALRSYIGKSLPKITSYMINAIQTKTLRKTVVVPINPDLQPKIEFSTGTKMDDEDYRKLIDELLVCRHPSDKLALITEKVKSFGDLEDVLFDAEFSEEEVDVVLAMLGEVEIAALLRGHPFQSDIEAVDLSAAEQTFRLYLQNYVGQLAADKRARILSIEKQLAD